MLKKQLGSADHHKLEAFSRQGHGSVGRCTVTKKGGIVLVH